jgi:hypothetical protein
MNTATATAITNHAPRPAHVHAHAGDGELAPISYEGPIASAANMNPLAHGGHTICEACTCGMTRWVNVREYEGGVVEREEGAWQTGSEVFAQWQLMRVTARGLREAAEELEKAAYNRAEAPKLRQLLRDAVTPALANLRGVLSIKHTKRSRTEAVARF